jgi:hypothetical protein
MCWQEAYLPSSRRRPRRSNCEHSDEARCVGCSCSRSFPLEAALRFGETDLFFLLPSLPLPLTGESKPFIRNVFTLDTCARIDGSDVREFRREEEMLRSWGEFVKEVDPDIIIGYNTSQFDIPYLMDRAKALQLTDFPYLSRLKGASAALPSSVLPSFARLV